MLSYDASKVRKWWVKASGLLLLETCLVWVGCSDPQINEPRHGGQDDTVEVDANHGASNVEAGIAPDARASEANPRDAARTEVAKTEVDGGAQMDAPSDGGGSADAASSLTDAAIARAGFPSWVSELPGRYAARVVSFSSENDLDLASRRAIYLVDIASQPDGYEMKLQYCELVARNVAGTVTLIKPTALAPLRHRMLFAADSFSTEPLEWEQGYEREPPESCTNHKGELVAKRPFQTWIPALRHDPNLCRCPGPLLPEIDDCRVLDPDQDGHPGFSLAVKTIGGIGDTTLFGVSASYSRYIEGRRDADGVLRARQETKETAQQHGCDPDGCANLSGTLPSCSPASSVVEFVPLDRRETPTGGWSCEAVMVRTGVLFPTGEPPAPQNCHG